MRCIVKIKRSPTHLFLVDLKDKKLLKEIKGFLEKKRNKKAVVTALSKGVFLNEVCESDLPHIAAGLILSEENTHYSV